MKELFEALPIEQAMPELLPSQPSRAAYAIAEELAGATTPEVQAAIWLYVDDLDRSHTISQGIAGPIGAYWHGIMHRREGDFWNSKYWFRQARGIDLNIDRYDPMRFVDAVEATKGDNPEDLVDLQRKEWMALFTYCTEQFEMEGRGR